MSVRASVFGLLAILCSAACGNDAADEDFDYGRDEMKNAIEGTWEGTSTPAGSETAGAPVTLTLVYSNADTHALCDQRVLAYDGVLDTSLAPRCMSTSWMNIYGTFTSRAAASAPPRDDVVRGRFAVWSLRFTGDGELEAEVGDGKQLTATLSNDVLEGSIGSSDGKTHFTLRRRQ